MDGSGVVPRWYRIQNFNHHHCQDKSTNLQSLLGSSCIAPYFNDTAFTPKVQIQKTTILKTWIYVAFSLQSSLPDHIMLRGIVLHAACLILAIFFVMPCLQQAPNMGRPYPFFWSYPFDTYIFSKSSQHCLPKVSTFGLHQIF